MNSETYDQNASVVERLKKIVPVVRDEEVADGLVRVEAEVPVRYAERMARAIRKEGEAIEKVARRRHWDPLSGDPNPKLSGPPQDPPRA